MSLVVDPPLMVSPIYFDWVVALAAVNSITPSTQVGSSFKEIARPSYPKPPVFVIVVPPPEIETFTGFVHSTVYCAFRLKLKKARAAKSIAAFKSGLNHCE